LTNLVQLRLRSTALTGNVSNLTGLTNLEELSLDTSVTGNVSSLSGLTSLTLLNVSNTILTGDISSFAPLTNALYLFANATALSYTTTSLPAWSNTEIRLQDCGLSSAEVDDFFNDLDAGGGSNGSLDIAGTNGAATGTSATARTNLVARGWSLNYN